MPAEEKPITEREFLENWGLYRIMRLPDDWDAPKRLSLDCAVCRKETTWGLEQKEKPLSLRLLVLQYRCVDCGEEIVVFMVLVNREYDGLQVVASQTQIVGRVPRPSAKISRILDKHLSGDAEIYVKGLTCRNEGFGIGAVSYIRRVVENKTSELIDVIADLATEEGLPASQVEKLRSAKHNKTYDKKLEVAAPLVPTSLRPGGTNPLGELHRLLSLGLHGRTEDECLQIADDTREIFEYVFERLRAQIDAHRSFKDKVTKIASKWKK